MIETLRLVTCLYGANGRLPFEGGVALALLELAVASRRARGAGPEVPGFPWLPHLPGLPDVRLDVIAGSSAGGVVGAVLAKQILNAADPEAGFAAALESIIELMDVRRMTPNAPAPDALLDKRFLSRRRMFELLGDNVLAPGAEPLEPEAELWVSLVQVTGQPEYVHVGGEWFEDMRYVEARRYDRVDFARRPDEVAAAVDATSANPWFFAPTYLPELDSPAGHLQWLRERAGLDPHAPPPPADLGPLDPGPAPLVPCYDGGILDNQPLEEALDAAMRRGLGTRPGERLVVLVVDPVPDRVERRQLALLERPADGRRAPQLQDQMAALGRAGEIVRHERVADDLLRLAEWTCGADPRGLISLASLDADGRRAALADAADRLLFECEADKVLDGPAAARLEVLADLARVLAAAGPGERLRDGLMRAGARVRRLLRHKLLWEEPHACDLPGAARMRGLIDRLLTAELTHMRGLATDWLALNPGDVAPDDERLRCLLAEAATGRPLPCPRDVLARRVAPPAGGLSSDFLEPLAGFFDRDNRCHDLLVGLVAGRKAVAGLLPPSLAAAWRAHFRLDEEKAAMAWFADAPSHAVPWRDWHAGWERVFALRADQPTEAARRAREVAKLRPRLSALLARLSVRFWAMSGSAKARGATPWVYALGRGPFAPLARFLVPWLLRFEARFPRIAGATPTSFTRDVLVMLPPLLLAGGSLAASRLYLALTWGRALALMALTFAFAAAPMFALIAVGLVLRGPQPRAAPPPPPASEDETLEHEIESLLN
jgi:hypothetical protein